MAAWPRINLGLLWSVPRSLCGLASGKEIWHLDLGQDWQASPMTYMMGGRQYVALPGPTGVFSFALGN
jgi:hypothetical protein